MRQTYKAMYKLRMKQMKLLNRSEKGLVILIHMTSLKSRCCSRRTSCSKVFSPEAFISFLARRIRIMGAYVSLKKGIPIAAPTPAAMAMTMKIHLNPMVCAIKPPHTGPTAGPIRGPNVNIAIATAENKHHLLVIYAIKNDTQAAMLTTIAFREHVSNDSCTYRDGGRSS